MNNYHPTVKRILELLKTNNCWYETFEHAPVKTSEEASKIRIGYQLNQGAKALIVRVKIPNRGKSFYMLVMPGDKRLDNDKLKTFLGAKDLRFATVEEVSELIDGVQVGGVPPFGNLFGLKVIVDNSLFENEKIVFNAGDRSYSIAMKSEDYKKIVEPQITDIVTS